MELQDTMKTIVARHRSPATGNLARSATDVVTINGVHAAGVSAADRAPHD